MGITNRVALVTGAAGGMGKYTAKVLAQHGAKVAINDIVPEALEHPDDRFVFTHLFKGPCQLIDNRTGRPFGRQNAPPHQVDHVNPFLLGRRDIRQIPVPLIIEHGENPEFSRLDMGHALCRKPSGHVNVAAQNRD